MRSMVEGARVSPLAALAPLHRTSCGPPPRFGEELYQPQYPGRGMGVAPSRWRQTPSGRR
jgi:hypothetical protein